MNDAYIWYSELIKPAWAPPNWLFGPVWTILYVLIAISFGTVILHAIKHKLSWIIALPFLLNLIFNFAFTPLQFGLKNNLFAAVDIICVLLTLIWGMLMIKKKISWIVYINLPYLVWVSFATILQLTITYLNR